MEYAFKDIEKKWQQFWKTHHTYKTEEVEGKPKYYVLDMFPYPSGAGLHVGHPLGYIASDIYSRYKKLCGFNVLHPMGFDSFGLPAEQYAIQTGQHPTKTTQENIARYKEQLNKLGFNYDWSREVQTSDPSYYRWTQWIFLQLFNSWYNPKTNRAEPIDSLVDQFKLEGRSSHGAEPLTGDIEEEQESFTAEDWNRFSDSVQQEILMPYRLAYLGEAFVNWCPALGTVLANDEVVNGYSERGAHPVERKLLKQWSLRITAYAQRLLDDLAVLDWSESIKETQKNWIGRSEGASVLFVTENGGKTLEVFTTRPDTIFGVSYLAMAPEHSLIQELTTEAQKADVEEYVYRSKNRSERERMADVSSVSGVFTGAYVKHPLTQNLIPVWVADYVLVGYGTGVVMAVPAHDERDFKFATHFEIPFLSVIDGGSKNQDAMLPWTEKDGTLVNSGPLNGLMVKEGISEAISLFESNGCGKKRINFRLRDAVFGRQRYWGEPIPIYYEGSIPKPLPANALPLTLPEIDTYLPTEQGDPPLGRAENWKFESHCTYELSTMPGWAGSSWYFIRYVDPENKEAFVDQEKINYWKNVDLYVGGAEHATGHLLYARFWTKFLYDLGLIPFNEPFEKMINQGMILGRSSLIHRIKGENTFVSKGKLEGLDTSSMHVDISMVNADVLDVEAFKKWRPEYADATFVFEDSGAFLCDFEVEKMSKSKYNVQTPDELVERYGADTLRMYEMFLGPIEQSKPWDTQGITGVHSFLKRFWKLFHLSGRFEVKEDDPTQENLRTLHKTIRKITEDFERFSFNTGVSTFMICVNELMDQQCNNRQILEPLIVLLSPYAPHITEELWCKLGNHEGSLSQTKWPKFNPEFLVETSHDYPISFNGKMRFKLRAELSLSKEELLQKVLAHPETDKWLEGKEPKNVIIVPGKIVNVVL
ncbi:MAG: leucine--tRNA ligase [Crocinitomicaceae bacterium]|jgi:leucyl-tRNA synthetase